MVGISGALGLRSRPEIASARTRPALTKGSEPAIDSQVIGIWPLTTSASAGPPPLYATSARSIPDVDLKSSPTRYIVLPSPADP